MNETTLKEWGELLATAEWNLDVEIGTLVTLARSRDAAVALRAIEAIRRVMREILDQNVQRQIRRRLEIERRNRSMAGASRTHRESDPRTN